MTQLVRCKCEPYDRGLLSGSRLSWEASFHPSLLLLSQPCTVKLPGGRELGIRQRGMQTKGSCVSSDGIATKSLGNAYIRPAACESKMELLLHRPHSFGWEFIKGGLSILSICLWKPRPHHSRTQEPLSKVTRRMSLTLCGRAASWFDHLMNAAGLGLVTAANSLYFVSHTKLPSLPHLQLFFDFIGDLLKMALNSLWSRGWHKLLFLLL